MSVISALHREISSYDPLITLRNLKCFSKSWVGAAFEAVALARQLGERIMGSRVSSNSYSCCISPGFLLDFRLYPYALFASYLM
jgi:hypothetical protein